jgi:hypothetical protein
MRYEVAKSVTGKYLVIDSQRRFETVAAGLTKEQAEALAERLNDRQAWGR